MSIRGIVKHIDKIDLANTQHIAIPNGIPLVYKFDKNMNPVPHRNAVKPLSGIYLEKKVHTYIHTYIHVINHTYIVGITTRRSRSRRRLA